MATCERGGNTRISKLCFAVALAISLGFFACGWTLTPEEVLQETISSLGGLSNYRVDIKTEMPMFGKNYSFNSTMTFKQPDKMHMITNMPMMGGAKQEMYFSDGVFWTYMPAMKMAMKMEMSSLEDMPKQPGTPNAMEISSQLEKFWGEGLSSPGTMAEGDAEYYVVEWVEPERLSSEEEKPRIPFRPKKHVFWIDIDGFLLYKMIIIGDNDKAMMSQTYTNYQLDAEIDDSEFEFTPPAGVQVMDGSKMAKNMMKDKRKSGAKSPDESLKDKHQADMEKIEEMMKALKEKEEKGW